MERAKIVLEKIAPYFLIIVFAVGIAGHLIGSTRSLMLGLTPYALLITGIVVLVALYLEEDSAINLLVAMAYVFTMMLEVIGENTGDIFGIYTYGETLGFKLMDVPLIIGLNWVLVIIGIYFYVESKFKRKTFVPLITALIAVAFDFILEPVATKLDYWSWEFGIIPLQNYIVWFVIAYIMSFVFVVFELETSSKIPSVYVAVQIIFFLSLNIFL